ncbi:MAG: peptidase T4 [Parvibaculum sp.]|nr:peptidase T4 [Parvibaculum sp.]
MVTSFPPNGIQTGPRNLITDVDGIKVGQAEDGAACTGTTVILPDAPVAAAVNVMGGAPGTRETDALDPSRLLGGVIDAVTLSGGSVYGLDAGSGVTAWLGARGRGFEIAGSDVRAPIVPGAILFDLSNGGDKGWGEEPPYRRLGAEAAAAASESFELGNAGAGFGARAGSVKGGTGSASLVSGNGLQIGALMVVNSYGSAIVPGSKAFWAAPFERDGEYGGVAPASLSSNAQWLDGTKAGNPGLRQNTTIGIVATNADLTAAECNRVAVMAHDGLARALRPAHAPVDGDVIFAIATGTHALSDEMRVRHLSEIGTHAGDCVARAIARGVYEAETLGDMIGYRDAAK